MPARTTVRLLKLLLLPLFLAAPRAAAEEEDEDVIVGRNIRLVMDNRPVRVGQEFKLRMMLPYVCQGEYIKFPEQGFEFVSSEDEELPTGRIVSMSPKWDDRTATLSHSIFKVFTLRPKQAGTVTINPIDVECKGYSGGRRFRWTGRTFRTQVKVLPIFRDGIRMPQVAGRPFETQVKMLPDPNPQAAAPGWGVQDGASSSQAGPAPAAAGGGLGSCFCAKPQADALQPYKIVKYSDSPRCANMRYEARGKPWDNGIPSCDKALAEAGPGMGGDIGMGRGMVRLLKPDARPAAKVRPAESSGPAPEQEQGAAEPLPGAAGAAPGRRVNPYLVAAVLAGALGLLSGLLLLWMAAARSRTRKKEAVYGQILQMLKANPAAAHGWYQRYRRGGGDPLRFDPQGLIAIFDGSGLENALVRELSSGFPRDYVLEAARLLSERNSHGPATALLGDELLLSAAQDEAKCDQVVRIFSRALKLKELVTERSAGKPEPFQTALAEALLRQEHPAQALHLLESKPAKGPEDHGLMARALVALGRREEALAKLDSKPRADWTDNDYCVCFWLLIELGLLDRARKLYGAARVRIPVKSAPELHYNFALRCERSGDARLAAEIYGRFAADGVVFRDAAERLARLREAPWELAAPPAAAELLGGKYELRRPIGQGGMGVVLEGFDRNLGRRVAVKRMRAELNAREGNRERFLEEARIVSHLTHPFIVGIHEILEQGGDIYLVFDYVDGKPLSRILDERKRLPLAESRAILGHVCQAVDFAHRNKVLHRDLKPSNIMVDGNGFARVMDFGLAREAKDTISRLTRTDASGTPAYMAPEQHLGRAVRASDVYCIGVCLYEMVTGKLPFLGPDFLAQKERGLYAKPTQAVAGLPEGLDGLVAAALHPDPKLRIEDPLAFLETLKGL